MQGQLVTIFGGSGFLGRYVVTALARQGARIRVAVRRPDEALYLKPLGSVGQIVVSQANLRAPASVAAAVAGADAVINLVGILFERSKQNFEAVHAQGAGLVAEAARKAGAKRLIHISALGADMESPSAYARSKAEGEARVRENFPGATIFRPSVVFGPEDRFFNLFASLARISPVLPLIGGGATRFQPVYVGDVAAAIEAALADPTTAGKIFELGGPDIYSFADILRLVVRETGRWCLLVPVPFAAAKLEGAFLQMLPVPPLTVDQVRLLERDNVASGKAPGLKDLGITPTPVEGAVQDYLIRFRRGGRLAPRFG